MIISRAQAKADGLTHYFTGKPCKNGHLEKRLTKNGTCMVCNAQAQARYKSTRTELMAKNFKDWREKNLEKDKNRKAAWRRAFPEKNAEKSRRYGALKMSAIPAWNDKFIVQGMYEIAAVFRRVGIDMHVDHIVPLKSKKVCGLHSQDNLQLITGSENSKKHNRYWPDMWQGNTP